MIDVEALLQPIAPDLPCGDNLEYDSAYGEMERATVGKPEQQFGATVVPAEDPNWREVKSLAIELAKRTKDLRVAVPLARAGLASDGFSSFSEGLGLIRGYVERYWETVHPQLDPDDGNDPVLRVNTVETLCDPDATLNLVRQTPLVSSRLLGRFNLRDVAVADGDVPPPTGKDETPPDWSKINGAFSECTTEEISANSEAVNAAIDHLIAIEKSFTDAVGSGVGVNLKPLVSDLRSAAKVYTEQLKKRGVSDPADESSAAEGADGTGGEIGASQRLTGQITSREDVLAALDKICDYYSQYEPSSPLPLLVQRCKRLVPASFLEIVRDILPDALPQAEAIRGNVESE
jgi:type VI secretion system protein ImpA